MEQRLAVPALEGGFDEAELAEAPEPVRRYFRASLSPGAPMARAARIVMRGHIKLGGRWIPFRARETLAPHEGFVWAGNAARLIFGSDHYADGAAALDWKLLGLVRVAHAEGPDVARSAAGRAGGEAIWLPSALLPRFGVRWDAVDGHHLTASYGIDDVDITARLEIDSQGAVLSSTFERWGDPGNTGSFDWHPFGVIVTSRTTFDGMTVPAAGRAGWHIGSDRWEEGEFFRYEIADLQPIR